MRRKVFTQGIQHFPMPGRQLAAVCCCVLIALVTSCGSDTEAAAPASESTASESATPSDQGSISVTVPGTLAAGFAELQAENQGQFGMAIQPVGSDRKAVFGDWTSGPAWSTMKVPLALAASRSDKSTSQYSLSSAITASDNSAGDTLWESLGTPEEAAGEVQDVLREGGDKVTDVPSTKDRSGYSVYGQAEWSLADQVQFASRLPCLAGSEKVTELMDQIVSSHQWGLGSAFDSAKYKGGWGPDTSGAYLVRQFGLVSTSSGTIAIAFAVEPDSGSFSEGSSMLSEMGELVSEHLDELTGGRCPS